MRRVNETTEAWFRKPRRIIHNQKLMQTVLTLAFLLPMPMAAGSLWLVANSPAMLIQAGFFTWLAATAAYLSLLSYVKVKTREQ